MPPSCWSPPVLCSFLSTKGWLLPIISARTGNYDDGNKKEFQELD